jgi:hypothetical protein
MVWTTVVSGAIATVAAIMVLRPVGRMLKHRPSWWYFGALALVVLVAVALVGVSMGAAKQGTALYDALWGLGLGLGFGGLAGLRYGHDGLFTIGSAPSARKGTDRS